MSAHVAHILADVGPMLAQACPYLSLMLTHVALMSAHVAHILADVGPMLAQACPYLTRMLTHLALMSAHAAHVLADVGPMLAQACPYPRLMLTHVAHILADVGPMLAPRPSRCPGFHSGPRPKTQNHEKPNSFLTSPSWNLWRRRPQNPVKNDVFWTPHAEYTVNYNDNRGAESGRAGRRQGRPAYITFGYHRRPPARTRAAARGRRPDLSAYARQPARGPTMLAHRVAICWPMLAYGGLSCGQRGPILWLCWPMFASCWPMLSQKIRKMGTAKKLL